MNEIYVRVKRFRRKEALKMLTAISVVTRLILMMTFQYPTTKESCFIFPHYVLLWTAIKMLTKENKAKSERTQTVIILFYAENYKAVFKVILLSK